MKNPFPLIVQNMRNANEPLRIVGRDIIGHPRILIGKMKRPDTLSWSGTGRGTVLVNGLWRTSASYGRFECPCEVLCQVLQEGEFLDDLASLRNAMAAWGEA